MDPRLLTFIVAVLLSILDQRDRLTRGERLLDGRLLPWVCGAATAVVVAFVWPDLNAPGAYHDERAYVVQARLLASFSWTAPTPPVPMAWEMAHMFVEPRVFAKYPPGHAIALVPGVWLGMTALMPVLLTGATAALFVRLVRRLSNGATALLAWAIWTSGATMLFWHASYFSQTTTAMFWLVALNALVEWKPGEENWTLAIVVGCAAWIGITRPVTGIALGIPIGATVALRAWRHRTIAGWRRAAVVGVTICAMIPYWNWTTTGHVRELPYSTYSRVYFPFDMPGFTRDESPPLRQLTPDLEALARAARAQYRDHTPESMPGKFVARLWSVVNSSLGMAGGFLSLVGVIGLLVLGPARAAFVFTSFVFVVAGYLLIPQSTMWRIYYLEIFVVAPALVAMGLSWFLGKARALSPGHAGRSRLVPGVGHFALAAVLVMATVLPRVVAQARARREENQVSQLALASYVERLPNPRAVIFVRRDDRLSPHFTVYDILGPPERTPTWIVRDLGSAENARLLQAAGDRRPWLFDENALTLTALPLKR